MEDIGVGQCSTGYGHGMSQVVFQFGFVEFGLHVVIN